MKPPKHHIHTTVSENTYGLMKKLSLTYGSISKVIEEAVDLLKVKEHMLEGTKKSELDEYRLYHLMRYDFNMCAIGRTTFMSFIDKTPIPTEPQEHNICVDLVEWFYDNRPITKITLYEILCAIRAIWVAGNYFWKIEIISPEETEKKPRSTQKFEISFYHHFSQDNYGKYWSEYFKTVLEKAPIGCKCEVILRNENFTMIITKHR